MQDLIAIEPPHEAAARNSFAGLLQSLSLPGSIQRLSPGDPMMRVAEALLDEETSFASLDEPWVDRLLVTGARVAPLDQAAYVFALEVPTPANDLVNELCIGTLEFPDLGATLITSTDFTSGPRLRLSGPGVPAAGVSVRLGGVPLSFWRARRDRIQYPLGFDCFFVSRERVVGIPRSTVVEVI